MSVRIKVSYNTDEELAGVIRLLSPGIKSYRIRRGNGPYKRAYVDLNSNVTKPNVTNANVLKGNVTER